MSAPLPEHALDRRNPAEAPKDLGLVRDLRDSHHALHLRPGEPRGSPLPVPSLHDLGQGPADLVDDPELLSDLPGRLAVCRQRRHHGRQAAHEESPGLGLA